VTLRFAARAPLLLLGVLTSGCHRPRAHPNPAASASGSAGAALSPLGSGEASATPPPWNVEQRPPAAPEGMVWIPPGALVAGTPAGTLPRIADQEMPGEQVILKGFFISIYPYPDEEGGIPTSNVTQAEAKNLCEARKQRLCTELEWERACKGPDNHTYEYGDHYRADVCGTGSEARMLPSGLHVACRSDFGARDMHGSIGEWTASHWGRGSRETLFSVRGGNAPAGELAGRCAMAVARAPATKSPAIGFRCCAGPANEAEVELHVERKPPLEERIPAPEALARRVEAALPPEAVAELRGQDTFRVSHLWFWHPIGNEELVIGGGCTNETARRGCGAVIVRLSVDAPQALGWAASGRYVPTVETDYDPRYLWVYGGDERSHFRRLVTYAWGRLAKGELERNAKHVKKPKKAKKN
jgi:hypothetical protein